MCVLCWQFLTEEHWTDRWVDDEQAPPPGPLGVTGSAPGAELDSTAPACSIASSVTMGCGSTIGRAAAIC